MNTFTLKRSKFLHVSLIISLVFTFFVFPAPAKAGLLSSFLNVIRPVAGLAGNVGGAILGASMAAAIVPPLGMIAGGILGWIAGGIITSSATSSLGNLAFFGVGALGAMAMGPSLLGMAGGFLIGGILGKIAMGLIQKADRNLTGGVLFNAPSGGQLEAITPMEQPSSSVNAPPATSQSVGTTDLKDAQENYQKAYQSYIQATQNGADTATVRKALTAYQDAFKTYQQIQAK